MRKLLLLLLLCASVQILTAHTNTAPDAKENHIDSLYRKAERFGKKIPQEKVFVHLDNTCYFVGDTLRYKGYVTRSDNGRLTTLSRILYVELLSPDGYLVERQQLEMTDGTAHGAFCLKDSLYAGYYELRAYTRWMLNFGCYEHPHSRWTEELFYSPRMAKDFFRDYDKLYSRVFPVYDQPSDKESYPKDMTLRPLRRYYKGKKGKPDLDVRFYPEGGEMVAGTSGRIAFEANTAEGRHLELELSIRDRNGNEVARTRTVNRGRGVFTLADINAKGGYRAVFRHEGYDYEVKLPRPATEGCAMSVKQEDGKLQLYFHASFAANGHTPELGLQIMHNGVSEYYSPVDVATQPQAHVTIPTDDFPTGIHQLTLFDGNGRIYADRLVFVNHHDHDRPGISVTGIRDEYQPFEPIDIHLKAADPSSVPHLSLSVRDRATDENTHDNGTILTEMLLCSELKGFVESPGYYFEKDEPTRTQALDLLMMVQGWRRYSWKMMAGVDTFVLEHMPEQLQTITGCVNKVEDFRLDRNPDASEASWIPGKGLMDYNQDKRLKQEESVLQDEIQKSSEEAEGLGVDPRAGTDTEGNMSEGKTFFYGGYMRSSLKKEVNVWPSYIQGTDVLEGVQSTQNGCFHMKTPKFYGNCILFLPAADLDKGEDYIAKMQKKDYLNEEAIPDYYVKLDRFYPIFPKPYTYYRHESAEDWEGTDGTDSPLNWNEGVSLGTVTVRSKRGGLRKLNLSKPALVVDAYETFNLAADYGLNSGTHNWITFPQQIALAYVGDMGMERDYFVQVRYDGMAVNSKRTQHTTAPATMLNGVKMEVPPTIRKGKAALDKYHFLRNLGNIYIYTDYAPREQGSRKYELDNQPDVVIDLRLFKNDAVQPTYRDRRYILRGYSVCEDFYSPDYSKTPLPDTKDYRRTLYWTPKVEFDGQGEATVRFYNNGSPTVLSIDAEGITPDGTPVVWSKKR